MKFPCTTLLLAAALGVAAQPAAAAGTYWSAMANGCVPDSASIQNNRYLSAPESNFVGAQTGKIDPIILVCNVAPNFGAELPNTLSLTYLDSTSTAIMASVQAQLIRVSRTNGARAVVASVSSNNRASAAVGLTAIPFAHAFNFDNFFYLVRIVMDRNAANQNIRAIGVALDKLDPG